MVISSHLKNNHTHKNEIGNDMLASDMNKSWVELEALNLFFEENSNKI